MIFPGFTWVSATGFSAGIIAGIFAFLLLRKRRVVLRAEQEFTTRFMYSGNLSQTGLLDAVQFLEIGNREGVLHLLYESGEKGYLVFLGGRIIDAFFGENSGKEAIFRMLENTSGEFYFESKTIRQPRLMDETMMDIAIEWDELRNSPAPEAGPSGTDASTSEFQSLQESLSEGTEITEP
jgi:hypothetical protein